MSMGGVPRWWWGPVRLPGPVEARLVGAPHGRAPGFTWAPAATASPPTAATSTATPARSAAAAAAAPSIFCDQKYQHQTTEQIQKETLSESVP